MTATYSSSSETAYESVRFITHEQVLGWFVRGLHYWSAGTMVFMLFFHVFRQLLIGGYKAPREGTWTIGVFIFFFVIVMAFTGYTLRWDERAIYAIRVALNIFHEVPVIGEWLVRFVQGGPELSGRTLTRFFSVHALFVPAVLVGLIAYHLYLVVVHGVTSHAEREEPVATAKEQKRIYKEASESDKAGERFHPTTIVQITVMAFLIFCFPVAMTLIAGPSDLMPKANLTDVSFPAEEWWFWWISSAIALLPPRLVPVFVVGFPMILFFAMLALPYLDRGPNRGIQNRPVWTSVILILTLGVLGLSALRTRSPWTGWPSDLPPLPAATRLPPEVETGYKLFGQYGCTSCHAIAGRGRSVGPDLARLPHRPSKQELVAYIERPPQDVAMPSYAGRMTPQELDAVAEFVLAAQTFPKD